MPHHNIDDEKLKTDKKLQNKFENEAAKVLATGQSDVAHGTSHMLKIGALTKHKYRGRIMKTNSFMDNSPIFDLCL